MKKTDQDVVDYNQIKEAINKLHEINNLVNESKRKRDSLIRISQVNFRGKSKVKFKIFFLIKILNITKKKKSQTCFNLEEYSLVKD